MRLFGTSGIRGTLKKIRPDLVSKLGMAFGAYFPGKTGVGRDARTGSELLALALTSGILYSGNDVVFFGLTSTPSVLHATKALKLNGSAMVTGSHTPPEIHGVLLFEPDTSELHGEHERELEELVNQVEFRGKVGGLQREDADPYYLEDLVRESSGRELKVVIDVGHSPIVSITKSLLRELGWEHLLYNEEIDGSFPNRGPEPDEESLRKLGRTVTSKGADLGIAFDGDGDRAIFVDERGFVIHPDRLGTALALRLGGPGDTVVCPINSSMIVEMLREKGMRVIYTRIGPPAIVDSLIKHDAFFGFEESGKYIWPENILYGDPLYTLIKLAEIWDEPISSMLSEIPDYPRLKKSYPCPDENKGEVMNKVRKLVRERFKNVVEVDGVRVNLEDGWFLLRPSGTEPVFRLYAEAVNITSLKHIVKIAEEIIVKVLVR